MAAMYARTGAAPLPFAIRGLPRASFSVDFADFLDVLVRIALVQNLEPRRSFGRCLSTFGCVQSVP
jgi:hypothetical protein